MRYEEPTDNRKKEPSGIKKKKNLRKEEDAPSGSAIPKEKKEVIDLTLEEVSQRIYRGLVLNKHTLDSTPSTIPSSSFRKEGTCLETLTLP